MAIMQRANVVLQVKDDQVQKYLDSGYCQIDEVGNVITSARPTDEASLRAIYVEQTKEIERLKAENEELKAKLAKSTAKTKAKVEE